MARKKKSSIKKHNFSPAHVLFVTNVHESTDLAFSSDEVLHSGSCIPLDLITRQLRKKHLSPSTKAKYQLSSEANLVTKACQIAAAHQKQGQLKFLPELQLIRTSLKVFCSALSNNNCMRK
jgi:hypothetical protein